jgi:hypothetical protein
MQAAADRAAPARRARAVRLTPGAAFLVLAGGFGLFFALATPPHDPPDEARHHARAWLVSGGWLRVVGEAPGHAASVPRGITQLHPPGHHYSDAQVERGVVGAARRTGPHDPAEVRALLRGSLARWDLQPVRILTPYSPILYVPYLPALWIARALELSAAAGLLLARLLGLGFWLGGIWLTLRIAPCQRWLLAAAALLPMSVFQAASISADPPTQLAIFWLFAEWLRAAARGDAPRSARDVLRLLAAALALGLVKPGYAPLALACAGLPGSLGARLVISAAALAAAALPTLGWAVVLRAAREPAQVQGADPIAQLQFVLGHPLAFLAAVGDTVAGLWGRWLAGMVGNLGHFDVEIPKTATALGLAAVAASASLERGTLAPGRRLLLLGAFLATSLALLAMAYLGWTPVGAERIPGVQGRYFLLMLPFALVALPRIPRVPERSLALAVGAALALVLAISAVAMLRTYYAP